MKYRLVVHLCASLFVALAPQLADAQYTHVAVNSVDFGRFDREIDNVTTIAGSGIGDVPDPYYCSTFCPSSVSAGGVSGKRTGKDGYVATSWGPAGPLNTGYYAAPDYRGQKLASDCPTTLVSNTTYSWCKWSNLSLNGVTGVIIHGCIIYGTATGYTDISVINSTATLEYCEFRPPASAHFQANLPGGDTVTSQLCVHNGGSVLTINHSECWGMADGVDMGPAPASTTLNYIWMHDWRDPSFSADHTDGYLDNCFSPTCTSGVLTVTYSTIAGHGNTNAIGQQNASQNGYSNTTITHSYFAGFGYTVSLCGHGMGCLAGQNNVFTDNQFGDDFQAVYGNLYGKVFGHFLWRRNTWKNTDRGYDAANAAAHNGKFVFPDGTLASSDFTGK